MTIKSGWLLLLFCAASVLCGRALAQEIGDPGEGRRLAAMWCSNCHVTEASEPASANDVPPNFRSVARMASTTMLSLRAFLRTSHRSMPNFNLTDPQVDDLSAYILSLRTSPRPD